VAVGGPPTGPTAEASVPPPAAWRSTVDLPAAGEAPWGGPMMILKTMGRTLAPDSPAFFPTDASVLEPVRSLRTSAFARSSAGQPWLFRLGVRIPVESQLEAKHACLVERGEEIEAIVAQPLWISYRVANGWGWACPDLLVAHRTQAWTVVESKPRYQLKHEQVTSRLNSLRASLRAWGLRLEVLHDLPPIPGLNYDLLHTERRPPLHVGTYADQLLTACREPRPLRELFDIGRRACVAPVVWHLIWKGDLCVTWEEPITLETMVRRHDPESPNCQSAPKSCGTAICGPLLT
jgi:hypothetical protein